MKKLLIILLVCFWSAANAAPQEVRQRSKTFSFNKPVTLKIDVASPPNDAELISTPVMIEGVIIHNLKVADFRINGASADLQQGLRIAGTNQKPNAPDTTIFSYEVPLQPGSNHIRLEVVNSAGEMVERELTLRLAQRLTTLPIPERSESYAVIIGVADYADPTIPDLKYTVNDAKAIYELLTDSRYGGFKKNNVKLLLNQQATVPKIKSAIGTWLPVAAAQNATVVVFFAGHGAPERDHTFWLTHETQSHDLYATALSNNEIADMLSRIKTNCVITFLDCCYSAATVNRTGNTRNIKLSIEDPFKALNGRGRITITASDGKQPSIEDDTFKHGIFTYRLLEGLKGKADKDRDGMVIVEEVWDYVKNTVTADAHRLGHLQEPTFIGAMTSVIPLTHNLEAAQKKLLERQKEHFSQLHADEKIDGPTYELIKKIIEGAPMPNLKSKQRALRDYLENKIELATLIELASK